MTSGRYLGEIVRLVLLDILVLEDGESLPPALLPRNALPTRFLSEVVARKGGRIVQAELEARYPAAPGAEDEFWTVQRVEVIRDVAEAVQGRSSALIAAACVGLLDCVGDVDLDAETAAAAESGSRSNGHGNGNGNGAHRGKREIEELVIAYTGGTISQYPKWLLSCQQWIDDLVEEGSVKNRSKRVTLREALDGGIIGAGVLAGMAGEMA